MERQLANTGRVGRTLAESIPSFAEPRRPRPGAPNVVMIVVDDLGFGDFGCYGSDLATPTVDRLAEGGLRYNNFHVTPLCSPTRACLLTGRNHHAVGMGFLSDFPMGLPGYTERIPKSAATLPRLLHEAGYSTFAVGKWHLAPRFDEGPGGPFDRWPLGMGFERFYGFIRGMTNQWTPELVRDNGFIDPPLSPEEGYHLTEDLASQAIRFVQDQRHAAPDKPFFLYFATGAMHVPHQVPRAWIESYQGRFNEGWDAVRNGTFRRQQELGVVPPGTSPTARPPWIAPWERLSSDECRLFARQMEVYAGFLTHTDAQIGRLIDFLARIDVLDNTIVIVLSDHGASGPSQGHFNYFTELNDLDSMLRHIDDLGGFRSINNYAAGWAWVSNTPFRGGKGFAWLGGVRVPLILHWPAGVPADNNSQVRPQFCHAIDLLPTILDAAAVEVPEMVDGVSQQPLDGRTFLPTFREPSAASPRDTQYFEMIGSRAIYHNGWKATTDHVPAFTGGIIEGSRDFDADRWSLFYLEDDFSEAHDLAAADPTRLRQMIELWWLEAGRNQVLPLTDDFLRAAGAEEPPYPATYPLRDRYVCLPDGGPIETPSPFAAGFRVTADIEIAADRHTAGIICAQHVRNSGCYSNSVWACYILDGRLVVTFSGDDTSRKFATSEAIPPGRHEVVIICVPDPEGGSGSANVSIDGVEVNAGAIRTRLPLFLTRHPQGMLLVGRDQGFPVCDDYHPPFPFTGHIHSVVFEVPPIADMSESGDVRKLPTGAGKLNRG